MKVIVNRAVKIEIGPLDHAVRLPMAGRIRAGMKTNCDACGEPITDEFFIGGFKAGHKNLKLHEGCSE
jgi:hypothetical protein